MILVKTLFFKVFLAIVKDSKIGTPALFNEDKVLEKFAKHDVDLDYANRWNTPLLKKKLK